QRDFPPPPADLGAAERGHEVPGLSLKLRAAGAEVLDLRLEARGGVLTPRPDLAQVLLVPLEVLADRRHEAVHRRLTRGELGVDLLSGQLAAVRLGRAEGARAPVRTTLADRP